MEALFLDAFEHLEANPAFWLCLTLGLYVFGQVVFKAAKFNPFASPIIIAVALLITILVVTGVPYETYFKGANFIHFRSGPRRWRSPCRFTSSDRSSRASGYRSSSACSAGARRRWSP